MEEKEVNHLTEGKKKRVTVSLPWVKEGRGCIFKGRRRVRFWGAARGDPGSGQVLSDLFGW